MIDFSVRASENASRWCRSATTISSIGAAARKRTFSRFSVIRTPIENVGGVDIVFGYLRIQHVKVINSKIR